MALTSPTMAMGQQDFIPGAPLPSMHRCIDAHMSNQGYIQHSQPARSTVNALSIIIVCMIVFPRACCQDIVLNQHRMQPIMCCCIMQKKIMNFCGCLRVRDGRGWKPQSGIASPSKRAREGLASYPGSCSLAVGYHHNADFKILWCFQLGYSI